MMITRIEWIKDTGVLRDFRWTSGTKDFGQVNVVYGGNGSGKTSVAGLFRRAVDDPAARALVSLRVKSSGSERSTDGESDPVFTDVCVFGRDFVEQNHDFRSATPSMPAVLTVGRRAVEAERELEDLKSALPGLEGAHRGAKDVLKRAEESRERAFRSLSQAVVADLAKAGGMWQSASRYTRRVAEDRFERHQGTSVELSTAELQEAKAQVVGSARDRVKCPSSVPGLRAGLGAELEVALSATPVTLVLDSLQRNPAATQWVDTGRALHAETDSCIYCGSALTPDRRADIEAHFSDEVAALDRRLARLDVELARVQLEASNLVLPHRAEFYSDLQDKYDMVAGELVKEGEALSSYVTALRAGVAAKRANVLAPVVVRTVAPLSPDAAGVLALIEEHNVRVDDHVAAVDRAALRVEQHHFARTRGDILDRRAELEAAVAAEDQSRTKFDSAAARIAVLSEVEGDPAPSASVLTDEVARLLGRRELAFGASGDGRYWVTRVDGSPACGLSEGERTAITLVHFLEMLARREKAAQAPIVFIDDPVSSLDSNVFVGASTAIWAQCVVNGLASQVFLLTHDFELFRQWQIQMDGAKHGLEGIGIYELRARYVAAGSATARRCTELVTWDAPTKRGRPVFLTAYHQAFSVLVDAHRGLVENDTLENRINAQLLLPNVLRRLLETFLAFKVPHLIGDFSNAMRICMDGLETEGREKVQPIRVHLTRFAHQYSHSESPDISRVISPDEVGATISQALAFMQLLDPPHFEGLCTMTGRSPVLDQA
ncbi:AAA family ATPase [Cellulomonas taurus]|uniref:AAA family ATPase n=1 Tax=Cellulomonas taurus TaxID=2729175 RepID=UPI00145FB0CF|nr:AAA family ATPase [Cellulomonas taurus]